ncbi:DUF5107 domain-containing protein [Nonomuraea sp. NPDC046570]|uniref:DUF5107 domain-containing protein n=1 Tax=Nonomuraea sp. NPDC046570 TaxID=3155255 RepID=UPI0033CA47A8
MISMETIRMPAAAFPRASPLPILHGTEVPASAAGAYGMPATLLPYTKQDGYDRRLAERDLTVAVLENEQLKATFLLDYGGRLWSLEHRASGRELLHRNPIVQPANIALRGAWLAGGVEWNLGTTGHWPLTSSPLHAVRAELPDGTPVLRMYEYERMRRLVVQLDAYLPSGSPYLLVHVRIRNPHPHEVPVYWWSNIAVPETPGTRVIAPADHSYHYGYEAEIRYDAFPPEASYTARAEAACDHFFDIPAATPPWIAALDSTGRGLLHASTGRLRGRKMFCWGTAQGGRRWQEWLSGPGAPYLEIQGGLARTQLEHLPMPARSEWSWLEAYGLAEADPAAVHGDWGTAVAEVAGLVPALDDEFKAASSWVDAPPVARLYRGSGWGALERAAGALPALAATPFEDDTLGPEQKPWLELLAGNPLPASEPPADPVLGEPWRELLRQQPADWHSLLHRGLLTMAEGDAAAARTAWEDSLRRRRTPWALRNLAELDRLAQQHDSAADRLAEAHALAPGVWQLTAETLSALLLAGRSGEALAVLDSLDAEQRAVGRIRLLECRAALAAGDRERAGRLLDGELEVPDLREGEDALHELWYAYHDPGEPLPGVYDFRMH